MQMLHVAHPYAGEFTPSLHMTPRGVHPSTVDNVVMYFKERRKAALLFLKERIMRVTTQ